MTIIGGTGTMEATVDRISFTALGTGAVVVVTDPRRLDAAVRAVRAEIDLIDRTCSRFRSDSALEHLNTANGRRVAVDPILFEAISIAVDAAIITNGDVDPTIGRALRALGYDRTFADVVAGSTQPPREPAFRFEEVSGWRTVELDPVHRTVRLPPGVRLDLGATAKAWAADRAAAAAATAARCGTLVSLGGDISCAGDPPDDGWLVDVAEWHAAPSTLDNETIATFDGGVATSSTTVRRWRHGDSEVHHVVDPRTGDSARSPWRTVSVCARSCLDANIATTASIVRGAQALDWLDTLGVPARLVAGDGSITRLGGWPEPGRP